MSTDHEPRGGKPPAASGGDWRFSRRGFLRGAAVSAAAAAVAGSEADALAQGAPGAPVGPGAVPVTLTVNGKDHKLDLEPRVTLLDALRNRLDLTGAKKVCDRATCGACTVHVDGKPTYSCTCLAVDVAGKKVSTIEGLAAEGKMSPISEAFVHNDAQQCGFCTPGFVMACQSFLTRNPKPSAEDIRQGLGGNLCRCGTYVGIIAAVQEAAGKGG